MTVKTFALILSLSSTVISGQNLTGYKITGTIIGAENKTVFISLRARDNPPIDSCVITHTNFTLKGNVNKTDYYKLYIQGKKGARPLIISNTTIFVIGNADSIWTASVIDNPPTGRKTVEFFC
jgi:hypothetical protein